MKLTAVVCPSCGAKIQVKAGIPFCFCTYCGTQIHLDDGSTTHTHRKVDEARIREAELNAMLELKKMELAEKRRQDSKKAAKYLALVIAGLGLLALLISLFSTTVATTIGVVLSVLFMWELVLILSSITDTGSDSADAEDAEEAEETEEAEEAEEIE